MSLHGTDFAPFDANVAICAIYGSASAK